MKRSALITLLGYFFLLSCNNNSNNKDVTVIYDSNQVFLRVTGKRQPLVHDPISIIKNSSQDDVLLLPIPKLEDGIIEGNRIPVQEGHYKYQGHISINKNVLIIDLQIINTDDNKIIPESFNGTYNLIR